VAEWKLRPGEYVLNLSLIDHIVQGKGGTLWPNERITAPPLKGTGERLPLVVDKLNTSIYSACKARTALKDDVKLIKA